MYIHPWRIMDSRDITMALEVPLPLLEDIANRRCLPFIGAGFSLNARVPSGGQMPAWKGLIEILATTASLPPSQNGPEVAATFEQKFGRVHLIEALKKALLLDHAEPGSPHLTFAQLPFDTIYTTNFDLLLEDAFSSARRPFRSIVGEHQLPFHAGPFASSIVKMHGDLRHEEHIVITSEDYSNYIKRYAAVATHLAAMLITRTALFIGYSLTDPDFEQILEIVRSRLGKFLRMGYIIQFDASEDTIRKMLSQNLHVIPLNSSESRSVRLTQFLKSIEEYLQSQAVIGLPTAKLTTPEEVPEAVLPVSLKPGSRRRARRPRAPKRRRPKVQTALNIMREDPLAHLPCKSIVEYRKSQIIFAEDDPANNIYLVLDGKVKVSQLSEHGPDVIVGIYSRDEFFGESALLKSSRRMERATALEATKLMYWSTPEIDELVLRRPRLGLALLQMQIDRCLYLKDRVIALSVYNVAQRLAESLITFAQRFGSPSEGGWVSIYSLTREMLAQYVGCSKGIIDHYLNIFRRQGYLLYSRRYIGIHAEALKAWLNQEHS